jgi:hypothetical protein
VPRALLFALGHFCECGQYTTVNRSWLDCRDYGRVKSRAY